MPRFGFDWVVRYASDVSPPREYDHRETAGLQEDGLNAKSIARNVAVLAAVTGTGVLASWGLVRPWHLRWGATHDEVQRPLPGDELVENPRFVSTRAITINAPAESVWPWLVQLGYGRGGFYSYDWLENLLRHNSASGPPTWRSSRPGPTEPSRRRGRSTTSTSTSCVRRSRPS
jgi:hypothetical protein